MKRVNISSEQTMSYENGVLMLFDNITPVESEEGASYNADMYLLRIAETEVRSYEDMLIYAKALEAGEYPSRIARNVLVDLPEKLKKAKNYLNSTDWIFAKCYELGLDPQVKYPDMITQRGEARELIRRFE